ncbi:Protein MAIN-LIKE 2 [Linum perenne]
MVERWRPETNTFHLYEGQATITLEDMHFIMGMWIDGPPVMSATHIPTEMEALQAYVETHLEKRPPAFELSSGRIKMSWLRKNFTYVEGGH